MSPTAGEGRENREEQVQRENAGKLGMANGRTRHNLGFQISGVFSVEKGFLCQDK
jgi:hypothetical protein